MKFIDWLRKLGILRFGVDGAVYRNAKERPASLLMDGVFNPEKDLVDFDKKRNADKPATEDKTGG